ncbi:MAG TPA: cupin domain-containing protein, partial [Nitrospira sp.]|nr:cupin domain-containing protein [Nitrospira sp.]
CLFAVSASAGAKSEAVLEALRWAKQAEVSGAAQNRERFMEETERALQAALIGGQAPDHRVAESVHALMEAQALGRAGNIAEGREDLQSAIVWLTRANGLPVENPSADWSPGGRDTTVQRPQGKDTAMDHFLIDIEEATQRNDNFRQVLFTAPHSQLVLMALKPGEEIGTETHRLDQFIRVEAGEGTARLNGKDYPVKDGSALVIPAGTEHNIINTGKDRPLKLYTIYSPPEHKDGTIHRTKQDAEADTDDHFDGKTTAMVAEPAVSR